LFFIVNAPPVGDIRGFSAREIDHCLHASVEHLERCGLNLEMDLNQARVSTPNDFARRYPGSGGAIYGRVPHGSMAAFRRPGSRSRIPGLYLAGGSVHPGPGVPMAALSGMRAATSVLEDFASTVRFHRVAMPGGISMV
jgi:1-hydroxycarotenoid 3,4-desaturase